MGPLGLTGATEFALAHLHGAGEDGFVKLFFGGGRGKIALVNFILAAVPKASSAASWKKAPLW